MYLGNMINVSWVIWAARELLCMHTFQLLSTVSDELVAVDSHDESCDHCLFSRHPLHMITQSKHKWLFCMINIIFFLSARYLKRKRSFSISMVDKCLFMRAETGSSRWNSCSVWKRCENSWTQLPLLKIRMWTCSQIRVQNIWNAPPFSIFMTSAPNLIKNHCLKCQVCLISWVKVFCAAGGPGDRGQTVNTRECTSCWPPLNNGLIWSDLLKWTSFCCLPKKIAVFTGPPLLWVDSPFPGFTHIGFLFLGLQRAVLCLLWAGLQPLVFPAFCSIF